MQIASIVPSHRNHARKEWVIEEVRCVTADDIVREWSAVVKERLDKLNGAVVQVSGCERRRRRRRYAGQLLYLLINGCLYCQYVFFIILGSDIAMLPPTRT